MDVLEKQMNYQVIRVEQGSNVVLMQCDFEDKEQFKLVAQNLQYKILCDGKDVTNRYRKKSANA
jgi:hypothetical protein